MQNQDHQEYVNKFIDLLKGELGSENVIPNWDLRTVKVGELGEISMEHVVECYLRTKQEVFFQCQQELQKMVPTSDAEVMGIAKAKKIIADLIRNTTIYEPSTNPPVQPPRGKEYPY